MDDFVLIPLTKGMHAIVDVCDAELIRQFKWKAQSREINKTVYASRTLGFLNGKRPTQMMHRYILGITDNGVHVDHIDGNGLNNRRNNLRVCSHAENMWNSAAHKDNSTGLKGIWLDKRINKYCASIRVHGKKRYLGSFDTPLLANDAYRQAAIDLHGEFARA